MQEVRPGDNFSADFTFKTLKVKFIARQNQFS